VFTRRDDVAGDKQGFFSRPPRGYLQQFSQAGLLPCDSHC
jgi:hypothetical protein